jgi:hypothetical protein
MGASPQFTEAAIAGYLARHRGTRFRADHLAITLGASYAALKAKLDEMARMGSIRRGSNGRTVYYLPSDEDLAIEANAHRAKPFKPLSEAHMPSRDYDSRRPGSGDLLRVPSKHI